MNLFAYRDLWTWLNEPFTAPPPRSPEQSQGVLMWPDDFGQNPERIPEEIVTGLGERALTGD